MFSKHSSRHLVTDFAKSRAVSPTTGDVEFVVPGRLGAALLGPKKGLDKRGNVRQLEEELLRYFTGIGEQKRRCQKVIPYRTYEHNEAARQPQQNFNRQLRAFGRTIEDPDLLFFENYRQENERKFKAYKSCLQADPKYEKARHERSGASSGGERVWIFWLQAHHDRPLRTGKY